MEVKDGVLSAIGSDGRHYQIFMNPTKGPITLTDWIAPGVEVSLLTTPIKVRPAVDSTLQTTQFGLSNAGIYVGWRVVDRRYYFWNGGSRTYQIGIGGFLAPSVETLKTSNTASFTQADTQQLFISTGLAIPIRYNAASFVIVPLGFDYGISPESRRYRYHGRWWWGFGFSITFTELIGP